MSNQQATYPSLPMILNESIFSKSKGKPFPNGDLSPQACPWGGPGGTYRWVQLPAWADLPHDIEKIRTKPHKEYKRDG
jgi:hypothetical protein